MFSFLRTDATDDPAVAIIRRQAQTKKLLAELPWMWAIRNSWTPTTNISMHDLRLEENYDHTANRVLGWRYRAFDFWVKVYNGRTRIHEVKKLEFNFNTFGIRPGAAHVIIYSTLVPGDILEYVVHEIGPDGRQHYSVYRMHRRSKQTLIDVCAGLVRQEPAWPLQ